MTSATLFREGTDLETLLAELSEQYDGQVHVVDVSHTREGGVMGFFARPRVAVQFTVADPTDASLPALPTPRPAKTAEAGTVSEKADETTDPLDALIAAAEMTPSGVPPIPINMSTPVMGRAAAIAGATSPSRIRLTRAPAARSSAIRSS